MSVERQAKILAGDSYTLNKETILVLWFPNNKEVRLLYVVGGRDRLYTNIITPIFYFDAVPDSELHYRTASGAITKSEIGLTVLPSGWEWENYIEISKKNSIIIN